MTPAQQAYALILDAERHDRYSQGYRSSPMHQSRAAECREQAWRILSRVHGLRFEPVREMPEQARLDLR